MSVMSNLYRHSAISCLRSVGCPSAIVRRIRTVVIDPVKSETVRAFTHVGEKSIERFGPPLTHVNAASAIVVIVFGIWLGASGFGVVPLKEFAAACFASAVCAIAATTFAVTTRKASCSYYGFLAAFAAAQPQTLSARIDGIQ